MVDLTLFTNKTKMRTLVTICAALLILGSESNGLQASDKEPSTEAMHAELKAGGDEILTDMVGEIIAEITSLSQGDTREDLQKHFTTEGGLSTPSQRTYVSKRCPYIKIDVRFGPVSAGRESDGDLIQEISKPYLELSVID
ncbi:MAG: hypothetical protein AAF236_12500 [Verrucomicrobiota bacterium]